MDDKAAVEAEVQKVLTSSHLSHYDKMKSVTSIRSTFLSKKQKKNSSLKTVLTTANTMTMGAILVFPLLYKQCGIITSTIVMFVAAYVQYKTCSLIIIHSKIHEDDLAITIKRIMGRKWELFFNIATAIILLCVVLIYYLLACNMYYPIITTFMKFGDHYDFEKDKKKLVFNKFSFQYAGVMAAATTFILLQIKNINVIIKMGNIGFFVLVSYVIFLIYTTIDNFTGHNSKSSEIKHICLFEGNVIYIAGTCALAFLMHPTAPPVYNQQEHPENNLRDLKFGYMCSSCLNLCFGIFGYMGIFSNSVKSGTTANTVMDYYSGVPSLIVCFLYIAKLCTSIPVVFYVACQQIFNLIKKDSSAPVTTLQRQLFNNGFLLVLFICGLFDVNPTIVISLTGAFLGYCVGYLIPVFMHLKCIYGILPWEKRPDDYEKLIDRETDMMMAGYTPFHVAEETKKLLVSDNVDVSGNDNQNGENKEQDQNEYFCDHKHVTRLSRKLRYAYFSGILFVGLALVSSQIYQIVLEIKG